MTFKKGNTPWNLGLPKEKNPLCGKPLSEEHKRKISEALKGRVRSEEHRRKLSEANKGKKRGPHSEEHKRKLSEAQKGKKRGPLSAEHKRKISDAKRGKKLGPQSEAHRKKLSEIRKGRTPWNKGKKTGQVPWNKGKKTGLTWNRGIPRSDETRRKISESHKGKRLSEETKRKIAMGNKGQKRTESTKEKLRAARLKRVFPQKDTSIERILHAELDRRNIFYKKHVSVCDVCQPDVVFLDKRVALFADGDYWHSKDFKDGKAWRKDRYQDKVLRENDWCVIRFWGSEIKEDISRCVDIVETALGCQ